jgi:hypothetical protein
MEREYYELSHALMELFWQQKMTIHKQVNNLCTSLLADTELDSDILAKAVGIAVERNDSFRVRISKVEKKMKMYFVEHEDPDLGYLDFRGKTKEAMEKKLSKIARKSITRWGKQMSKIYLMHSYDGKCGIYFVVSHMIMDFWAISLFYKDVLAVYDALINGTEMPKPLASYEQLYKKEFNYKSSEAYKRDSEFWEKYLCTEEPIYNHVSGPGKLEKMRRKRKNPNLRYGSIISLFTKANNVMKLVPRSLVEKMEAYCAEKKVTMQSLVLLAYRSFLSKVNNREKNISYYSVVALRSTLEEKNSGGTRAGALPFNTIMDEDVTFGKACELISGKQSEIYRHGKMPTLELVRMWKRVFNIPMTASYVSSFVTCQPIKMITPSGMKIETKWYGNGAAPLSLYLVVMDGDGTGALKFYYEYRPHEVTLETVEKLHSYMVRFLEAGVANEEITIGELLDIE